MKIRGVFKVCRDLLRSSLLQFLKYTLLKSIYMTKQPSLQAKQDEGQEEHIAPHQPVLCLKAHQFMFYIQYGPSVHSIHIAAFFMFNIYGSFTNGRFLY